MYITQDTIYTILLFVLKYVCLATNDLIKEYKIPNISLIALKSINQL